MRHTLLHASATGLRVVALMGMLFAITTLAHAAWIDNGDGTVTDDVNGLMWDQCLAGRSGEGCANGTASSHTWEAAFQLAVSANASNYKGHNDWRLPTQGELRTLLGGHTCASNGIIDPVAFPNSSCFPVTSSSDWGPNDAFAWSVLFNSGRTDPNDKLFPSQVRLVRGGQFFDPFAATPNVVWANATTATLSARATPRATPLHGSTDTQTSAYYVVLPAANPAPNAGQIYNHVAHYIHEAIAGVVSYGSFAIDPATETRQTISGLTADSAYTLYLVGANTYFPTGQSYSASDVSQVQAAATPGGGNVIKLSLAPLLPAVTTVLPHPTTAGTAYIGVDGAGIFMSTTGGGTWTAAATQPTNTRIRALLLESATTLYTVTYGGGVFKSTDGGANWAACAGQPTNLNLLSLARDASGALYAGSEGGVYVSTDSCNSWTTRNSGLPM